MMNFVPVFDVAINRDLYHNFWLKWEYSVAVRVPVKKHLYKNVWIVDKLWCRLNVEP